MTKSLSQNLTISATREIQSFNSIFNRHSNADVCESIDTISIFREGSVETATTHTGFWKADTMAAFRWYIERTKASGFLFAQIIQVEDHDSERISPAICHLICDLSSGDQVLSLTICPHYWDGQVWRPVKQRINITSQDEAETIVHQMGIRDLLIPSTMAPHDPDAYEKVMRDYIKMQQGDLGLEYATRPRH